MVSHNGISIFRSATPIGAPQTEMSFFSGFMLGRLSASNGRGGSSSAEGLVYFFAFAFVLFGIWLAFLGVVNVVSAIAEWTAYFAGDVYISSPRAEHAGLTHLYDRYFRYHSSISIPTIIVTSGASIFWLTILLRSLVGTRCFLIAYLAISLALVTVTLTVCDIETACKANIVAFDQGEIWYLPPRDGVGLGALWGAVWLLAAVLALRWLAQNTKLNRPLAKFDKFIVNRRHWEVFLSLVVIAGSLSLAITAISAVINNPNGVDTFTAISAAGCLLALSILIVIVLRRRLRWTSVLVFLPVAALIIGISAFFHRFEECSAMSTRSGWEITYVKYCSWHQKWSR